MTQLAAASRTAMVLPIRQSPVRTAVRFPIELGLTIQTEFGNFTGVTENISATGLLLVCRHLPVIDGSIGFTMSMPAEILGTTSDVCIYCAGRIIRREEDIDRIKAAIVIDEYYLKA